MQLASLFLAIAVVLAGSAGRGGFMPIVAPLPPVAHDMHAHAGHGEHNHAALVYTASGETPVPVQAPDCCRHGDCLLCGGLLLAAPSATSHVLRMDKVAFATVTARLTGVMSPPDLLPPIRSS